MVVRTNSILLLLRFHSRIKFKCVMLFLIADAVWLSHEQTKKRLTKMKVRHKINYSFFCFALTIEFHNEWVKCFWIQNFKRKIFHYKMISSHCKFFDKFLFGEVQKKFEFFLRNIKFPNENLPKNHSLILIVGNAKGETQTTMKNWSGCSINI